MLKDLFLCYIAHLQKAPITVRSENMPDPYLLLIGKNIIIFKKYQTLF